MPVSVSRIPTADAPRLLKRLCTHWAHKFDVKFDALQGLVPFDATTLALLEVEHQGLRVQVEAANDERLDRMQSVVAEHLQRMNRGEPLAIDWKADND